jgi:copper chaperone CopZ
VIIAGRAAMPASPNQYHARIAITGMTCTGCVNAVTRVLSRVPGAAEVRVDLESGRADVQGGADPAALVAAVRKAGYGAELLAP